MESELTILAISAVSISFLHTLAGPDHYLPFVALAKSRNWSVQRTIFWTLLCGLGHVGSSVLLGLLGAAFGWSLSGMQSLQQVRGGIAGWALLVFGLLYCVWGAYQIGKNRLHKHFDVSEDGTLSVYEHRDGAIVLPRQRHAVTPWVMFLIFLLGPCEPLIPLLFLPAAKASWYSLYLLIALYTAITLATMLSLVLLGYYGVGLFKTGALERYVHVLGGFTIFICGFGIVMLEW